MAISFIIIVMLSLPMLWQNVTGARLEQENYLRFQARALAVHVSQVVELTDSLRQEYLQASVGEDVHAHIYINDKLRLVSGASHKSGIVDASATYKNIRVELSAPDTVVTYTMLSNIATSAALGTLVALMAWLGSIYFSKKLQAPLSEFADAAQRIGSGDTRSRTKRYGLPEIDAVAEVLDQSAQRIEGLIENERRMVSEVGHQLRTPLTALSLQIDEITEVADDPELVRAEAAAAAIQVDRLTQAMQDLVQARRGNGDQDVAVVLSNVISPVCNEIETRLRADRRHLNVELSANVEVSATAGAIRHVISILLENSVVHGRGEVSLTTEVAGDWVTIKVEDEGDGLLEQDAFVLTANDRENVTVPKESTIGFGLARTLTATFGGRLEWRSVEPAAIRLYVPLVRENPFAVSQETENRS